MELNLKEIKKADIKSQYLVFGFVKECQLLFEDKDDNIIRNITDLIIYTIIAFYAHFEFFEHFAEDKFKTEDDGRIITKNGDELRLTAYGSIIIPFESEAVYTWKIRILKGNTIAIGIDEASRKCMQEIFFNCRKSKNYAYASGTGKKYSHKKHRVNFLQPYSKDDVITMELNMKEKSLSFAKNDDKLTKAYDNIEESADGYSLAVFIRYKYYSIQLLSYQCRSCQN